MHNAKKQMSSFISTLIGTIFMKKNTHPASRPVVFMDMSTGTRFIISSTARSKDTLEIDGKTYPLVKLEVSSDSHPFYTGAKQRVHQAGQIEKFFKKFSKTGVAKFSPDKPAATS